MNRYEHEHMQEIREDMKLAEGRDEQHERTLKMLREEDMNAVLRDTMGKIVHALRKSRGERVADLADYAGTSPSTISRIERETLVSVDAFLKVLEYYGLDHFLTLLTSPSTAPALQQPNRSLPEALDVPSLAKKLRQYGEQGRAHTLEELANALNFSPSAISRFETGNLALSAEKFTQLFRYLQEHALEEVKESYRSQIENVLSFTEGALIPGRWRGIELSVEDKQELRAWMQNYKTKHNKTQQELAEVTLSTGQKKDVVSISSINRCLNGTLDLDMFTWFGLCCAWKEVPQTLRNLGIRKKDLISIEEWFIVREKRGKLRKVQEVNNVEIMAVHNELVEKEIAWAERHAVWLEKYIVSHMLEAGRTPLHNEELLDELRSHTVHGRLYPFVSRLRTLAQGLYMTPDDPWIHNQLVQFGIDLNRYAESLPILAEHELYHGDSLSLEAEQYIYLRALSAAAKRLQSHCIHYTRTARQEE